MDRLLSRITSALLLSATSGCFNPNGSDTETSTGPGSSSSSAGTTNSTGTSEGPSTDTTAAPTTAAPTTDAPTGTSPGSSGSSGAPTACDDGEQNGDETDTDCGGSCPGCDAGMACLDNTDCSSMACLAGACLGDPECLDAAACTPPVDACQAAVCLDFACATQPLDGDSCDDGLLCTLGDTCAAGVCKSTTPKPVSLADVAVDPGLGLTFDGPVTTQLAGSKVVYIGDFNADSVPDFAILAHKGMGDNPRVYVVFGGPTLATATLENIAADVGGAGVFINVDTGDASGVSISSVGDFNKDGAHDLLIGTPGYMGGNGAVHVVFGKKADTAPVKLSTLQPPAGIRIAGTKLLIEFGVSVAALGDLDNNEFADFALGAPGEQDLNNAKVGAVYVFYGAANLNNDTIGNYVMSGQARRIQGPTGVGDFGRVLAGVGNINADTDKTPDLAVGQPSWSTNRGRVVVLYLPKTPIIPFTVQDPLPQDTGVIVKGPTTPLSGRFGSTIAAAGDFNADGTADFIIGGTSSLNKAFIVLGRSTLTGTLDATDIKSDGFALTGTTNEEFGTSVGGGLDVNGDGISDVVVGAPGGASNFGRAFVAFGRKTLATIASTDLALGKGGLALDGQTVQSRAGTAVALITSMNADTRADILISAPQHDANSENDGRTYLVYGGDCKP